MTTEEKAKAYDEALERAKDCLTNKKFKDIDDTPEDLTTYIFPQLAESEDERIRKAIIELIHRTPSSAFESNTEFGFVGATHDEMLNYLEKQKPIQSEYEKEYIRTIKSLISDFLRGKQEIDTEYYQKIYDWLDERHVEQKHNIETCPHSIKSKSYKDQKPAPISCGHENGTEWSEEDDMLMDELESYILYDKEFNDEQKSWRIKRLKSLRPQPHWKPNKEQMEALNALLCIGDFSYVGQATKLQELYTELKKLM